MRISKAVMAALVDELGQVKAEAAAVSEKETALKTKLINLGLTEVDGKIFRATISTADRETRDPEFKDKIEELVLAHTTPQYRSKHTKTTPVTSVRVVARVQVQAKEKV